MFANPEKDQMVGDHLKVIFVLNRCKESFDILMMDGLYQTALLTYKVMVQSIGEDFINS